MRVPLSAPIQYAIFLLNEILRCANSTEKRGKSFANSLMHEIMNHLGFLIRNTRASLRGFRSFAGACQSEEKHNNLHSFLVLRDCILENCIPFFYEPLFLHRSSPLCSLSSFEGRATVKGSCDRFRLLFFVSQSSIDVILQRNQRREKVDQPSELRSRIFI